MAGRATRGHADAFGTDDRETLDHAAVSADPWQVLQVSPGASQEEIHAAYKQLLFKYHPDRVAHLGDEFQRLAHHKTLAIQQAYAMLTHRNT